MGVCGGGGPGTCNAHPYIHKYLCIYDIYIYIFILMIVYIYIDT